LNKVSTSCSYYFFTSSFSPYSVHVYFKLHPFFLVRTLEMYLRSARLGWEFRGVERITGAERASLCIASTANFMDERDSVAAPSECKLNLNMLVHHSV
jgi:hypothetical protein